MAKYKLSGKKRKAGAKKVHHRRKRMGASGKFESVAKDGLVVAGGMIAAREVAIFAGSMFPSLMASPMTTGIAQTVVGGLLAWKGTAGWMRLAGLGFMGMGVLTIGNAAGVIGAPQTMAYQYVNRRKMGDPRLQFVAGATTRIGSYPNNFNFVAGHQPRKNRYTS